MKTVMWVIRLVVFMVVLWLALANQHNVQVFAPMGQVWQGPLVWVLLITLLVGVALGVFFYGAGLVGTAPCRQKGFGFSHRPSGSPTPCQAPGQPRNRLGR